MNGRHQIQSDSRQAFFVSMLLHGGALVFLLLMILVQSLQKKPPEHVFELVEATQTADRRNNQTADSEPSEPIPDLKMPELEPIVEPPPRPRVEIRRADPEPEPEPQPEPEPEMITADQFREEYGEPRPRNQPVRRPVLEVPKIDTSRLQESLESLVVSTSSRNVRSMTSASQDQLSSYISALRSRINAVWKKPPNYAGETREVVIVFDVGPNGTITDVRLEVGNSNDPFARSVLTAFQNVRPVGRTPDGQSYTFRMPFRIVGQ